MKMNAELRGMVAHRTLTEAIHDCAVRHGMMDLRRYAATMLLEGVTSLEEVTQVVSTNE